jgi:HPt (histidine-containing phosphotransfer) domain-containing protein
MPNLELDAHTWEGLAYLESVSGPGAIAEIMEIFQRDAPDRLIRMKASLGAGDRELLRRLAHDLKANSATMGVLALSALAVDLELNALEGPQGELAIKLEEIEAMLPQVLILLEQRVRLYPV